MKHKTRIILNPSDVPPDYVPLSSVAEADRRYARKAIAEEAVPAVKYMRTARDVRGPVYIDRQAFEAFAAEERAAESEEMLPGMPAAEHARAGLHLTAAQAEEMLALQRRMADALDQLVAALPRPTRVEGPPAPPPDRLTEPVYVNVGGMSGSEAFING